MIQHYGFEPSQTGKQIDSRSHNLHLYPLHFLALTPACVSGCMQFTAELAKYNTDPEIANLEKQIKQHFMPAHLGQ